MHQLQASKAAIVWSYFLKICAIPHPSKHEQALVEWIVAWASEHNITHIQDEIGNLILRKPATFGLEGTTPVILQAHLDMVPQKNSETVHNFESDAIVPIINGEWMHADNTTLGADNGIGMASCLAVLADTEIKHGPIEVLLTTSEEIGMVGAFGLEADLLKGKILINTDSEQEGDLYIGCAGGVRVYADIPFRQESVKQNDVAYEVTLSGLKGGHSGCDIHLQRANAITLLAETLTQFERFPFKLSSLQGGSLRNAIPREAVAKITCAIEDKDSLNQLITRLQSQLVERYKGIESKLTLSVKPCVLPEKVIKEAGKFNILNALKDCPNGVFNMDKDLVGVVQTSSNLGVLTQKESYLTIEMLVRSQVESEKQQSIQRLIKHFQKHVGVCRTEGDYPGWQPNTESNIFKLTQEQYYKLFATEPKTMVIHAGLECGLFSNKYPHWDMISFGPTIKFPHSPDEKVHIPSVDKYWLLLIETLKSIALKASEHSQ